MQTKEERMRQMFVQKVWCEGGDGEEGVGGVRVVMVRRVWRV